MDKPAAFRVKDATGKTVGELSDACADMVLGRGLCGVPSSDKRCSRKQAELTLGRNGSLTLVPRGVNPAYLKRAADKGGEAVMLQRNEKYSLEDGDIFTLVANSYPFTVLRCSQERPAKEAPMKTSLVAAPRRVEPVKEGAKLSIDNGSKKGQPASEQANQKKWKCVECTFLNEAYTTFCDMCEASKKESPSPTAAPAAAVPKPTPSTSLGTKRKAQDDDEEEEDAPRRSASPERKRPKIDSEPEDERPVCPYGEACYRKNPAHFKENSHPWLEKKSKSMTTGKKPTAGHKDGGEKLAPAKPAIKMEKPPKGSYTSDSAGPSNYEKEDIKKKKEEAPKPSEYESKKPSPKIPKGGDWMDEVPRPAPKNIEKPKPVQPSTPSQSTTSSKPSFSVPAQSQSTVSPSGKKTLKLIPPASPTKVAPGARLVLDYNSDEDEEEEIAPKQTGTSSSPQLKPPRPANVPVKKTPSLQSLAALLSQDERDSTSTSTSVTSKPKNGNTAKQPATDTTQTVSKALAGSLATAKGAKSLAFPSFGTSMLGMQPKRAAAVIRKTAKKFLRARADKDIRLVLLLEGKQDPVLVFFEEKSISDPRFTVATTPITKLDSVSLSSAFLATETDWRLRGGGTVSNRMVHEAAGPSLMQETKKLYSTASECGQVYPVPLPADSPLYLQQGVRAVVHCRPPNMNPAKPDCLNDEKEGKRLLKETYKRLFQFFGATLDHL